MEPIKSIISEVIGRMSSGSGVSPTDIQAAWVRISKDKGSRVADFKEGSVVVMADSSMRLVRLNLHRESLLKELKKEFPAVTKIVFKVGTC